MCWPKRRHGRRWFESRRAGEELIDVWNTASRYPTEELSKLLWGGEPGFELLRSSCRVVRFPAGQLFSLQTLKFRFGAPCGFLFGFSAAVGAWVAIVLLGILAMLILRPWG